MSKKVGILSVDVRFDDGTIQMFVPLGEFVVPVEIPELWDGECSGDCPKFDYSNPCEWMNSDKPGHNCPRYPKES